MHYKTPDNELHFIEPEFAYLLPAGSVPASEEDVQRLQPKPDPKLPILEKILELECQVTPRRIREAILTGDISFIADIESQIQDLRKSLTKL